MPLSVVVLAAGQGKRMRSAVPKVLQPLAGRPMLAHVLDAAGALEPAGVHVVYGYGGERVPRALEAAGVDWCLQAAQLGTGHAALQALPGIPEDHTVLILCGDVPLVRPEALARLVSAANERGLALATAELADPSGYGRVLRDGRGRIEAVVEHKDASGAERGIREINTGLLAAGAADLYRWLERLGNANAQGEYYLTDVVAIAVREGRDVAGLLVEPAEEVLGINDKAQLASAERVLQRREAERLMGLGVTLADPARVDVRGRLAVGADVFIDVGAVFEGDVHLGDRASVGPYAVISNSRIGSDCRIHAHTVMDGADLAPG
ncbi:MAG TPA: NTP transferase domain-containing protein, partial [Gammaproteobacteria bacterium]|nr:NTP transferase domain-containing protein [Gammaproteobacteria bacterium]